MATTKGLSWATVQSLPLTWQKVAQWSLTWGNVLNFVLIHKEEELEIQAGTEAVLVQLSAQEIGDAGEFDVTLEYDPAALQLLDATYHDNYGIPRRQGLVASQTPGKLLLRCNHAGMGNKCWTGLITVLLFRPLRAGKTTVRLS